MLWIQLERAIPIISYSYVQKPTKRSLCRFIIVSQVKSVDPSRYPPAIMITSLNHQGPSVAVILQYDDYHLID